MRLVVTADFHIHPYRICSRDGGFDRLKDGLSVLRQSLELARAEKAVWVFAGDFKLPKSYWPQQALTGSHEILREYIDVEKVLVAGNHDAEGLGGSGLAPFRDVAKVVEKPGPVSTSQGDLLCAPWNADRAEVRRLAQSVGGKLPLIAHGFLRGCALGPEDVRASKGIPIEEYGSFPVAFFGDIHKGQWLTAKAGRPKAWQPLQETLMRWNPGDALYVGSPYQQNWGERNDGPKGALVVNLKSGDVDLHPLGAPEFRHYEVDEAVLARLEDEHEFDGAAGDFVRVVYTGKPSPALDALKDWKFRWFQLITRRAPVKSERRADVHAGLPRPELLKRYMEAKPLPEGSDPEVALKAGLRLACD